MLTESVLLLLRNRWCLLLLLCNSRWMVLCCCRVSVRGLL